jgi:glyoxylase-like metal-dependent hydrolase (beta-lactamase superfamily II)
MILGDALTHRAISFRHPEWRTGSDTDADKGAATRKALLDRLVADKLPFIGYHLPSPGLAWAASSGLNRCIDRNL